MVIKNKYKEELIKSIKEERKDIIDNFKRYFNNSDSTNVERKEEAFIEFFLVEGNKLDVGYFGQPVLFRATSKYLEELRAQELPHLNDKGTFNSFERMFHRIVNKVLHKNEQKHI